MYPLLSELNQCDHKLIMRPLVLCSFITMCVRMIVCNILVVSYIGGNVIIGVGYPLSLVSFGEI